MLIHSFPECPAGHIACANFCKKLTEILAAGTGVSQPLFGVELILTCGMASQKLDSNKLVDANGG